MLGQIRKIIVRPMYLLSLAVLLLAFSFHFGEIRGTIAFSSDVEKSEDNKFVAGTWGTAPVVPRLDHIIITEALYDPIGTDTGKEWIELYNGTSGNVNMGGMELNATSGDYFVFPTGFVLNQSSSIIVYWNATGTDLGNNLYTGSPSGFDNMGNTTGWVALFKNSTHAKDTIIDYIEYGAGNQTWEATAKDAGIWTAGNFIPDVVESHSIERVDKNIDSNLASDFKDQSSPTPGS